MVLTNSLGKYVKLPRAVVKAFPGETVSKLTERIRFGQVDVARQERILIHVGTNDVADLLSSGRARSVTPQQVLRKYKVLRDVIRRRNSRALILFSSILLRLKQFSKFTCWVWTSRWRNGAPGQEAPVCTSHRTGGAWQAESQGRNYLLKMDFNWMVLEWIDLRPVSSRPCQRNISLPGWQLREQRSSESCLIGYGRGVAEWFGLAHWGWPLCGEYGPHLLSEDTNGRVRRCPGVCFLSKDGDWG